MNSSNFSLLPLEARQLLSVEVSNFAADDLVVVPGQQVTLAVDVMSSAGQAVAATFYHDVNNNGQWDPGIDRDLGASTSRQGNRFFRTITVDDWAGSLNIVADGVNTAGEWAASRRGLQMRMNHSPHFASVQLIDGAQGGSAGVIARPTDDSGRVRAVTFFLDRNNNGMWDAGLDTSLGTAFNAQSDGTYRLNFTTDPATWPRNPHIVCDAVDDDGDWSSDRPSGTIAYSGSELSPPPTTQNYEVQQDWAGSDGHHITLSVDALDNSAVRAVTFYMDYNEDGQWTPETDESLGTVFTSSNGRRYSLDVDTDFAGRPQARILADVTDYDDQWMASRPSVVAMNGSVGFVSEFDAQSDGGDSVHLRLGFNFQQTFDRGSPTSANYMVFLDRNRNGAFDANVDRVLQATNMPVDDGEAHVDTHVSLGADAHEDNIYGAAIVSITTGNLGRAVISPVRLAVQRAHDDSAVAPRITSFDVTLGSDHEFAVIGAHYQLRGTWVAPAGGVAISFFFDKNLNGHWDAGTDVDLGARFVNGTSGDFVFNGHVSGPMIGRGAFTAVIRDRNGTWSAPVSDGVQQIFAHPSIINVTPSSVNAPAGSTLTFDLTFNSHRNVRAATAFIDVNNDGMFNTIDPNYADAAFAIEHGNNRSGGMRLSINTTGLSPGTYTLYFAVGDHYHGHSTLPGGEAHGFWSQRFVMQITLT